MIPTLPARGPLCMTHWRQLLTKLFVGLLMHLAANGSQPGRAGRWNITSGTVRKFRDDTGMSTAEYAVGTVAAVGFAAVLYAVIHSSATRTLLTNIINRALSIQF